jgi:E3 ubiquitin-protein ligase RNF115/126
MINHLIFALAQRHTDRPQGLNPIAELFGTHTPGPEGGRWGDYVYNQEGNYSSVSDSIISLKALLALDQIITQLMENSNAHRPVPATEEIIEKLSKEVLMEKCEFLFYLDIEFRR